MRLNVLLILVLVTGLVGCASTQKRTSVDELQTRIVELEKQLGEKDTEITELKDDMQNLSEDMKRKDTSLATSTSMGENYKKEGIIRVDISPQKIQLALQNAGFYSGPIDGKVGEKTKKAIAEFQKANDLNADGIVGRKTWSTLKTYLN